MDDGFKRTLKVSSTRTALSTIPVSSSHAPWFPIASSDCAALLDYKFSFVIWALGRADKYLNES